jgi:hypothetical protein
MANEFYYCVSLSILHPTIDPRIITKEITEFKPSVEIMAGMVRVGKDGKPLVPMRKASQSYWCADLHSEEHIFSQTRPFNDFIMDVLCILETHRNLFEHLKIDGEQHFFVGWFHKYGCAAERITSDVLKKCGELGLDFELHCYNGPPGETCSLIREG